MGLIHNIYIDRCASTMACKRSLLKLEFNDLRQKFGDDPRDGKVISSDELIDGENAWQVWLKLVKRNTGSEEDDTIGIYLQNVGRKSVRAKTITIMRDALGKVMEEVNANEFNFKPNRARIGIKYIRYSKIPDAGALHVDVVIQIKPDKQKLHIPRNPFIANMMKLLENGDGADVSFKVEGTIVPAHTLILKMNSPILFSFCEGHQQGTPIPIQDTTLDNFRIILRYLYGDNLSDSTNVDNAKDLIIAANQYDIHILKIAVESFLIQSLVVNTTNVAEWLLFADAQTCPLLKEDAMSYIVIRAADLVNSEHLMKLKESLKLMNELMVEMSSSLANDSRFSHAGRNLSVNDLRKRLHEKGLDVDGTKSMLESRLRESNKRQRTE